ncbi:unnamed protein product [marine sediment metagenome]|uniref:Band 7 domain-containing protein n=1 Tax=marine sediment metagenome TaxID=412755 RepID=X0ZEW2_9ZZZZ
MRHILLPIFVVRPYERGIRETFGKYSKFIKPGLGFQIPIVQIIRVRDVREHTMDIAPQSVITKDNVEINVDGVMWVRPNPDEESIKRTFYSIDDWKRAIIQLAMTNLRQEFGDLTLDESLIAREKIAANLERNLYLVAELILLGVPVIVGLNMIDVAISHRMKIEHKVLQSALGIPVIPMIATKGIGIKKLLKSIEDQLFQKHSY